MQGKHLQHVGVFHPLLRQWWDDPLPYTHTHRVYFLLCTSWCERHHSKRWNAGKIWSNWNVLISGPACEIGVNLCFTKGGKSIFTCFGTFSSASWSSEYHQVRDQKLRLAIRSIPQATGIPWINVANLNCGPCIWLWIKNKPPRASRLYIKGLGSIIRV